MENFNEKIEKLYNISVLCTELKLENISNFLNKPTESKKREMQANFEFESLLTELENDYETEFNNLKQLFAVKLVNKDYELMENIAVDIMLNDRKSDQIIWAYNTILSEAKYKKLI
jgi:hypothetical protein